MLKLISIHANSPIYRKQDQEKKHDFHMETPNMIFRGKTTGLVMK